MKVTRYVHKDLKKDPRNEKKILKTSKKLSYKPKDDRRYETGNIQERGKLIKLGNVILLQISDK